MGSNFVTSVVRTGAQLLVGFVASTAAAWGLDIPKQVQDFALTAIVTGGMFLYAALVRYAETRTGSEWWPVLCRRVARVLMFGIAAKPAYSRSADAPETRSVGAPLRTL